MGVSIRQVIERLTEPVGRSDESVDSVDSLYFGHPDEDAKGIVTCFMPTLRLLEQAAALGANLVIAHEGPLYRHQPPSDGELGDDPVAEAKRKFILDTGLALYRFHDGWHRYPTDGMMAGLVEALAWEAYAETHERIYSVFEVPAATVRQLAAAFKRALGIDRVRVVGDPDTVCRRVGVMVGYRGSGRHAIPLMERERLDLLVYGEGPEWETPEYVRDAVWLGRSKALVVLGHAESEEPGMKLLADRLRNWFPELPVHYVKERPIFRYV